MERERRRDGLKKVERKEGRRISKEVGNEASKGEVGKEGGLEERKAGRKEGEEIEEVGKHTTVTAPSPSNRTHKSLHYVGF